MLRMVCFLLLVAGCMLVWLPLMEVAGKRVCCDLDEGNTSSPTSTSQPPKTTPITSKPVPTSTPFPKNTSVPKSTKSTKSTLPPKTPSPPKETVPKESTPSSKSTFPKKSKPPPSIKPDSSKYVEKEKDKAVAEYNFRKWPDRVVPYIFHPQFPKKDMPIVNTAVDKIRNLTCLRPVDKTGKIPADDKKKHKVIIQTLNAGCYATVGYNEHLATSTLNLGNECIKPSGTTVLHELCHVLGIYHMQSRYDRDEYITVHFDKVMRGSEPQFERHTGPYGKLSMVGLPYDYNSVMHYPSIAFGKEPNAITMSMKRRFSSKIGYAKRLSRSDVATLNRLYGCTDHYLGDDIPGGMSYKEWYDAYFG